MYSAEQVAVSAAGAIRNTHALMSSANLNMCKYQIERPSRNTQSQSKTISVTTGAMCSDMQLDVIPRVAPSPCAARHATELGLALWTYPVWCSVLTGEVGSNLGGFGRWSCWKHRDLNWDVGIHRWVY